jgi:hypothetical protein
MPRDPSKSSLSYLQKRVYDLPSHIFLVLGEKIALDEAVHAFCNAVICFEVLGCAWSTTDQ